MNQARPLPSLFPNSVRAQSSPFLSVSVRVKRSKQARMMGWVWREVKYVKGTAFFWEWEDLGDGAKPAWGGFTSKDGVKTVIKSEWTTEEVEPGKFLRKGNNVRQIVKMTPGK